MPLNPDKMVKLADGREIRRSDACFGLVPEEKNPNLLRAVDGTQYARLPNGSLVNVSKPLFRRRKK